METHAATVHDTPPPTRHDDFIGFWPWLRGALRFRAIGGTGIILPLLAATYYITGILHFLPESWWPKPHTGESSGVSNFVLELSYGIQMAVIFLMAVLHAQFLDMPRDERYQFGMEGQRRLHFWWGAALVSWLLFYIFTFCAVPYEASAGGNAPILNGIFHLLANQSSNGATLALLMCFSTMDTPARRDSPAGKPWVLTWIMFLIISAFIEGAIRVHTNFGQSGSGHSSVGWFELLAGASAGVSLAMFCGRLSSALLGLPRSVLALGYLYAVIEVSYGFWSDNRVALLMANLCLILKSLLSLVVAWLLTTRHLIFYMEQLHEIRSDLETRKNAFRVNRIALMKAASRDLP